MIKGAVISDDQIYRYNLFRIWDTKKPHAVFIGLNPSTADGETDDPTIRRCIAFAKGWGFGSLFMVNLFAYRATKPTKMMGAEDPTGADNDKWITAMADGRATKIICAWGQHGGHMGRGVEVEMLLADRRKWCLGLTKDGHPRHPLYVRADKKLEELPVL